MRVALAVLCGLVVPALALADGAPAAGAPAGVIGGRNADAGKWPDVAAVLFPTATGDEVRCTGTLVAPTVVVTAAHCYNLRAPPLPDNVLIGTSSLARPDDGETIQILDGFVFPDADTTQDVAVLILAHASRFAPRKIATGWARAAIVNGAPVSLVGFGAISKLGDEFVKELQEASSTITDFDCSRSMGCRPDAQPAGELAAGGMGIDTCPGDSGGPLYLHTSYGALLAGITSRSFDDAEFACSDGGIYSRADKIIDWLETTAGVPLTRGPEPDADPIFAVRGDGSDTKIHVNDPVSRFHSFAITTRPAHGTAKVRSDGVVRVCVNPDTTASDDELTVTITDATRPSRTVALAIKVHIEDGTPGPPCDFDDFTGGCDSRGGAGGAIPLAIGVLALLFRRRRCATLKLWPRPG
jgi:secreted trypsin-like serine protease